jgi:hypothetical protein
MHRQVRHESRKPAALPFRPVGLDSTIASLADVQEERQLFHHVQSMFVLRLQVKRGVQASSPRWRRRAASSAMRLRGGSIGLS